MHFSLHPFPNHPPLPSQEPREPGPDLRARPRLPPGPEEPEGDPQRGGWPTRSLKRCGTSRCRFTSCTAMKRGRPASVRRRREAWIQRDAGGRDSRRVVCPEFRVRRL